PSPVGEGLRGSTSPPLNRMDCAMRGTRMRRLLPAGAAVLLAAGLVTRPVDSACCYFSAKDKDILQPAQQAFLTWDPQEQVESFAVQPKFAANTLDFGMVIPTPSRPRLDEMPRDFFKELAVFTILKKREYPESKLLPRPPSEAASLGGINLGRGMARTGAKGSVRVLEAGVVGTLDYKIIVADQADDLFSWLKQHRYNYAGDEVTLDFYIQKRWFFTVMKIDT